MSKKMSCGGFLIDNESLVEQDGILKTNFSVNEFNVVLTPNSEVDLNGTMDKTMSEIYEAWQSGKRIIFNISLGERTAIVEATLVSGYTSYTYPSFEAYVIDPSVLAIMYARTGYSDNGEDNTYDVTLYQLAPIT